MGGGYQDIRRPEPTTYRVILYYTFGWKYASFPDIGVILYGVMIPQSLVPIPHFPVYRG